MDDITKRFAKLSPEKRALLEQKLKQTTSAASSSQKSSVDTITDRVAGLSPAKRALLALRLRQREAPPSEPVEPRASRDNVLKRVADLSPAKQALLALKLGQRETAPPEPAEPGSSADQVLRQVSDLSATKQAFLRLRLEEKGAVALAGAALSVDKAAEHRSADSAPGELDLTEEPPLPDWLTAPAQTLDPLQDHASGDSVVVGQPETFQDSPAIADRAQPDSQDLPASTPAPASEGLSPSWLESLGPASDTLVDDKDIRTAEATGMLAGISTLLPAEKVTIPTTQIEGEPGSLNQAVQDFHKIATEAPQPASLPSALTGRDKLAGNLIRAALLLGFVILLAVPLLLGGQTVANDSIVPWSEPAGESSDALDSQRRQLISEQLGIIDLQQPGSVALVSFDYSTATQGEMQPLADAILGRLKGQGMRIISVSLEPEGANIAQKTLEGILSERNQDEQYGQEVLNLGFLPGRIAAVRGLVAKQESLATIPDFQEGQAIGERPEWNDVQNLNQVDIVVTFADNPVTARWWVEQLGIAPPPPDGQRFILAATSASADPFLRPYRDSGQLDGLVSGINGAAAIEAGRREFGPARQMVDSMALATIIIIVVIAAGVVVGWMPSLSPEPTPQGKEPAEHNENDQPTT